MVSWANFVQPKYAKAAQVFKPSGLGPTVNHDQTGQNPTVGLLFLNTWSNTAF